MKEKPWSKCAIAMPPACVFAAGCRTTRPESVLDVLTAEELSRAAIPSNHRNWVPAQAVLPYSERQGNQLTVHNVRNCLYLGPDDYIVRHDDRTYDLDSLQSIDFIVVPFKDAPSLAHTMLSFDFQDQGNLACSVEVRLEDGESYSPVKGALRQYELMYVLADERDVIGLRAKHREDEATSTRLGDSRAVPGDSVGRYRPRQQAVRRTGILRHVHQQLHDESRRAYQPGRPRTDTGEPGRGIARVCGPMGL